MTRALFAAAVLASLAGCKKPDHIRIEPKEPVVRTRFDDLQLIAHVMSGTIEYPKETVTWTSENPEIATVDAMGKVQGKAGGRTRLIAKYDDLTASVPVEVNFVDRLETTTKEVTLSYEAGDPVRPQVEVIAWDGRKIKDRAIFYKPQNEKVCRVDSTGQIWPVEKGETVVVASLEEKNVEIRCIVK